MKAACEVIDRAYNDEDYMCVLTSGKDGKHKEDSLHYLGRAGDFRTRHVLPDIMQRIVARIKRELGMAFDVILEDDHLHVEYDPKGGLNV